MIPNTCTDVAKRVKLPKIKRGIVKRAFEIELTDFQKLVTHQIFTHTAPIALRYTEVRLQQFTYSINTYIN